MTALLEVDRVTVSFDGFRALNALSLVLEDGEMRAVIGPNGAGKTTMMDVITGKTRPDTGRVVFQAGIDLTKLDEPAIAALGIASATARNSAWQFLNKTADPRLSMLLKFCAAMEMPIEDLLADKKKKR